MWIITANRALDSGHNILPRALLVTLSSFMVSAGHIVLIIVVPFVVEGGNLTLALKLARMASFPVA